MLIKGPVMQSRYPPVIPDSSFLLIRSLEGESDSWADWVTATHMGPGLSSQLPALFSAPSGHCADLGSEPANGNVLFPPLS